VSRTIAFNPRAHRCIALEFDVLILGEEPHLIGGRGGQSRQVEWFPFRRRFTGIQPRDCEETFDDVAQPLDFFEGASQLLAGGGFQSRLVQHAFDLTAQRCERCSQLVRSIGDEAAGILECLIEAFDHSIERQREPLQLIARLGDWEPLAQTVGGDPLRAGRDSVHGRKRPLYQPTAAADRYQGHYWQADGEKQQPLPQVRLHLIHRRARFDEVRGAIWRFDHMGRQQYFPSVRKCFPMYRFWPRRPDRRRDHCRIEILILGRA
jgi:hypothetical protein